MKKNILIICHNNLKTAPRFLMEVEALKDDYILYAAGYNEKPTGVSKFIDLSYPPIINFYYSYPFIVKKVVSFLLKVFYYPLFPSNQDPIFSKKRDKHEYSKVIKLNNIDLVIVHHINALPLAFKFAEENKIKVVVNLHEYYPLEVDNDPNWIKKYYNTYMQLCKTYLPKAALIYCVGKFIADKYKEEFGVSAIVIQNSKPYKNISPVNNTTLQTKLIHHGAALRYRGIEKMIELMQVLDESYTLDLMLVPTQRDFYDELAEKVQKMDNVRIIQPVSVAAIPETINSYDIGLYILEPSNYNNLNALPNKFFEFIQARLALAIGPSPEMANIVNQYDLGVVAEDFTIEAMAKKIKELTPEKIMYYKNQCHKHAKELNVETNLKLIKESVYKLLN